MCERAPATDFPWGKHTRALDLGCAVGRSSFELRKHFDAVVGIDFSARFVAAAERMGRERGVTVRAAGESAAMDEMRLELPADLPGDDVAFERGDACALRADLGTFDFVLMANLIDRLPDPAQCLARLPELVLPGGWLVITSPYTWMEEYAARGQVARWRRSRADQRVKGKTRAGLSILRPT